MVDPQQLQKYEFSALIRRIDVLRIHDPLPENRFNYKQIEDPNEIKRILDPCTFSQRHFTVVWIDFTK